MEITPIVTTILFMTCIGAIAAIGAVTSARFFHVETDPRVEAVTQALPGVNCGACGYSGCGAAAEAVVKGLSGPDVCLIGREEVKNAVEQIMQVKTGSVEQKKAFLCCSRNSDECGVKFTINGPKDCRAAMMLYGGSKNCSGGCIGYGTCSTVCPVEAIQIKNGLPVIDWVRCTGCGLCVRICPKKILALIENAPSAIRNKRCAEYCVKKDCAFEVDKQRCIQCGICFKNCPSCAIEWKKGTAAVINKEKCTACYTCMRLCPKKVIS